MAKPDKRSRPQPRAASPIKLVPAPAAPVSPTVGEPLPGGAGPRGADPVLDLVDRMRADPTIGKLGPRRFDRTNPLSRRAVRIFCCLRAIEQQLLELPSSDGASGRLDPRTGQVELCFHQVGGGVQYTAYLQPGELALLMKNEPVARVLRRCLRQPKVA